MINALLIISGLIVVLLLAILVVVSEIHTLAKDYLPDAWRTKYQIMLLSRSFRRKFDAELHVPQQYLVEGVDYGRD